MKVYKCRCLSWITGIITVATMASDFIILLVEIWKSPSVFMSRLWWVSRTWVMEAWQWESVGSAEVQLAVRWPSLLRLRPCSSSSPSHQPSLFRSRSHECFWCCLHLGDSFFIWRAEIKILHQKKLLLCQPCLNKLFLLSLPKSSKL